MIAIMDLRKFKDGQTRLELDRLEVEAGEIAVVAGPAGSGKSVLLELLTGQVLPRAGAVQRHEATLADRSCPAAPARGAFPG